MSQSVVIKSNKYGIHLVLDKNVEFETILTEIVEKFKDAGKFFKSAKLGISFEGRELSLEQEKQIIDAITQNSSIKIICVVDNDPKREENIKQQIEHYQAAQEEQQPVVVNNNLQTHRGTLRSGQSVESDSGLIVLGDVNPGATVSSKGSVVVMGTVKGNVYAGVGGDDSAFIFALELDPIQIRIGSVIAKSPDKTFGFGRRRRRIRETATNPQIAYTKDGMICIEQLTKELLNNL
jgi:septum site-determining protein MinC